MSGLKDYFDQTPNLNNFHSLKHRLSNNADPQTVLQDLKEAVEDLVFCQIEEAEASLKYVMPAMLQIMQKIYSDNHLIVQSKKDEAMELIRTNFQVVLNFMEILNSILEYIMKNRSVPYYQIPSVPANVASMLFITFDHCKTSQKTYNSFHKSITEILELFRKTQEVHSRFLNFIDAYLTFDFLNDTEIVVYKEILDVIVKISNALSGINMKSMADNWKGYIALIQKLFAQNVTVFNLSPAIQNLTEEINSNLIVITEEQTDFKRSSQQFKIAGFLLKVIIKLFEVDSNISENYDDVLKFWITMYSWQPDYFRTDKFPDETINSVHALVQTCRDSVVNVLLRDGTFLKQLCLLSEDYFLKSQQRFGFLVFVSDLMNGLPQLIKDKQILVNEFQIVPLLQTIFGCTRNCYMEYFCDRNSVFYEEFVTNVSLAVLLFPNYFAEVERIFLECVIRDSIWTALIVTDIWCLVLRNSTDSLCRSTLTALICKIEGLKLGIFYQSSAMVRLKVLVQRIFQTLPTVAKNEELPKCSPTSNILVWKILSFRNIPLTHRYYIEFVTSDLCDKLNDVEKEDCSVNDVIILMEYLDVLSYTNFNYFEINTAKLIPFILQLWSFDIEDTSSNNLTKYFVYRLAKITSAVAGDLDGENLLIVLSRFKVLLNNNFFKLIICDILHKVSKRNFDNFREKYTLYSTISDIFHILLTDKSAVVVQAALESFQTLSKNSNYGNVMEKLSASSSDTRKLITDYMRRNASQTKYDSRYFNKICKTVPRHDCIEWSVPSLPLCKKMKVESDIDIIIHNLKTDTEKLVNGIKGDRLTARHAAEVRCIYHKLEMLLG